MAWQFLGVGCCGVVGWNFYKQQMGVEPKIDGFSPKMDALIHGKPYVLMDDLGVFPIFLEGHPNAVV